MLKVTQPYIRELPITVDGKALVLRLEPPGYTIGLRKRHEKTTYHMDIKDIWEFARRSPDTKQTANVPRHIKSPSIREEIYRVLESQGKLNIAQVMQQLKSKGMPIKRNIAGEILDMLKDAGKVRQEGFEYSLTGKK